MKPFNLEEALSGKPVKLRDGKKAYVIVRVPDGIKAYYPLRGVVVWQNPTGELAIGNAVSLTLSGNNYLPHITDEPHPADIIGMWEEAPTTKYYHINGCRFPAPCSEPLEKGQSYFVPYLNGVVDVQQFDWSGDVADEYWLEMGFVHTTQEAAQQHADAINSLFRGEPCPLQMKNGLFCMNN